MNATFAIPVSLVKGSYGKASGKRAVNRSPRHTF
jgi:hypothetical protein